MNWICHCLLLLSFFFELESELILVLFELFSVFSEVLGYVVMDLTLVSLASRLQVIFSHTEKNYRSKNWIEFRPDIIAINLLGKLQIIRIQISWINIYWKQWENEWERNWASVLINKEAKQIHFKINMSQSNVQTRQGVFISWPIGLLFYILHGSLVHDETF